MLFPRFLPRFRTTFACRTEIGVLAVTLLLSLGTESRTVAAAEQTQPTNAKKATAGPIRIDTGLIRGVSADKTGNVEVYRGIPYAAPPVGNLRLAASAAGPSLARRAQLRHVRARSPAAADPLLTMFPGMALGENERGLPVPQRVGAGPR